MIVSQRLILAVVSLAVLMLGVSSGAELDATAIAGALGVIATAIYAIMKNPPGSGSGDWVGLLKDPKAIGAVATIIAIVVNGALGAAGQAPIPEEAINSIVLVVMGLLASYGGRATG